MKKVAIGLSGGVDSAVSAALLVHAGYEVTGIFLECWRAPGCRVDEDRKDAVDVAMQLKIPFQVLDFKEEYKRKVVDYFYAEYATGRTPNPDVMCNREIKFGMFYRWAIEEQGFDFIATGHYARVGKAQRDPSTALRRTDAWHAQDDSLDLKRLSSESNSGLWLLRGVDEKKDQSYFLYQLREEQLAHILFPIGEMTKDDVRKKAKMLKLPVADKPDSQGICFIGEVSTKQFLKELGMKEKPGKVLLELPHSATSTSRRLPIRPFRDSKALRGDKPDKAILSSLSKSSRNEQLVIGVHEGVGFYTIGQRHGFRIQDIRFINGEQERKFLAQYDSRNMPPFYVLEKDVERNVLVVGTREQAFRSQFEVEQLHWIYEMPNNKFQMSNISVRIRHGGHLVNAKLQISNDKYLVTLEEEMFGVAPGQAAVFNEGEVVLGGGIIV
jgi:tRNA-uridine 2-sulfurtransferase